MLDGEHRLKIAGDVAWCRRLFDSIRDGGTWAIPRSGLIFNKHGNALVLVESMPWSDELPITEAQLREQQDSDYEGCVEHFGLAGIEVRRG